MLTAAPDVIMEYAYGRSDHRLEKADFGHDYYDAAKETAKAASLLKQMIWIFYAIQRLPEWLAARLSPNLDLIIRLHQVRGSKGPEGGKASKD